MVNIHLKAAFIESHAAQLRAEALSYFYLSGEEYVECLSELISDAQLDACPHKRIMGILADIGFCQVLTGALNSDEPVE